MTSTTSETTSREQLLVGKRASIAAAAGTAVEYYDFAIYGYLAVVIAPAFFPSSSGAASLLSTLALIGGGFFARPIGGFVFSRLGDRLGRRRVLLITVTIMGVATFGAGLLPPFASIGVAAPLLLAVLRVAQGISAGGEVGGATALANESAPPKWRGLFGSATSIGCAVGMSSASIVVGVLSVLLTDAQMSAWGWRIPFLLAGPLLIGCLLYRIRVEDSPLFKEMLATSEPVKSPVVEVMRNHRRALLLTIGIGFAQLTAGSLASIYIVVHLTKVLGYQLSGSMWVTAIVSLMPLLLIPLAGRLSDRYGRRAVLLSGFGGFVVLAVPCFALMELGSYPLALAAGLVLNVPFAAVQGVVYTQFSEWFPTRVRHSGVSLGFNIAGVIGSGPVSFVATWLVVATHMTMSPAFYMVGSAAVGLVIVWFIRETSHDDLSEGVVSDV
ncbi:MFS transporter [Saccharopolyspora sp. TS4A08]|uniref:MFS transporter n=1 Tax=Saccharopolyspora ipomoeae TaxID=3042027 RepID=A0ABT6PR89_9PSEU|nr:MFS transporter [Saccharopolyspora sp. TS4A08]MDI2030522.1 MFS transporter [Saccharopolyspora sp. TS4A08]